MRIRISHQTRYIYESPARSVLQILRLTPRDSESQHILWWRLEPSVEGRLKPFEDAFGNLCHDFAPDHPVEDFTIAVIGDVETHDTAGMVRGTVERVPDPVFLRETPLTAADDAIRTFASEHGRHADRDPLGALHAVMSAIHRTIAFDTDPTDAATTATQAFSLGRGVCQDLTHIFIACARHLGIPARYVSGYFHRADGVADQEAGHAWAEAKVPHLGWIGFDPANSISTTEAHVRVAIGLDYLGAAPIRGSRRGGGGEKLDVRLRVDTARRQVQTQS
ncbi:transglutaminase family protein [Enterovirga aerilata]|uniref:Transglutaminase family protein n=1 Tax=Enterovirga aerilata TaxID=2730920 RepID=A0A849I895_9HYPH|nr:transglutaminase family protein [Enterovirga sp. DB1703]NNM72629.1 transglutaminase family protein [Enterovirga sp. DB1703]